ncbi:MAG TPA: DNA-3-methyladenine glycosylase [Thermomicrobiales bacterium]|nr:DNA-3-methyladenine glycosylase [Thermomicrobiales bacterium]
MNSGAPTRAFFQRHPLIVAFDLLGHEVTVERDGARVSGRIVEVEAYAGPEDAASHAGRYRAGSAALASSPGLLYMYRSYGIHAMWNIVAHEPNQLGAVLIRAVEPMAGEAVMRERRGPKAKRLASGPGSVCQALGLRLSDDGADVFAIDWLRLSARSACDVVLAGPRIGITRGLSAPWRVFDGGSPDVSAHRHGSPVDRDMIGALIPGPGERIP